MLLTAYLADKKLAPLLMSFTTWDDAIAGNPLNTGWRVELTSVNLNRPRFVAELIRAARKRGWTPETARRPFAIDDGLAVLAELGYDANGLRQR
jgi:hypothetical protein